MKGRFRVWVWVLGGNKVGNPGLPLSLLNPRVTISLKLDMPSCFAVDVNLLRHLTGL